MTSHRRFITPWFLACALALSACAIAPVPTADPAPVDLQRYMGRWHVIAHVPYFAEKGDVASVDEYTLRDDGGIGIRYHYQKGFAQPRRSVDSRATVVEGTGNHDWRQWFFGIIPLKYRIIDVAPDDSWALVGYPGRDLAWVFSREPTMDDTLYRQLLERLRTHGVDTGKLKRVPQLPEQVGQPGFAALAKP